MKPERFTTYREENFETSSLEEELKDSSNFDEREQFNKKDSTFEDTRLTDEETEQLTIRIL